MLKETPTPVKTYPAIKLIERQLPSPEGWERFSTSHEVQILNKEQHTVGVIKLEKGLPVSGETSHTMAWIRDITIEKAYRQKGYGKAAYVELLKFLGDMPLHSGLLNSDASGYIWESLVRDGLAHEEYVEIGGEVRLVGYVSVPEVVKSKLLSS